MFFHLIPGTEHLPAIQRLVAMAGDGDVDSDVRQCGDGKQELYPGMHAVIMDVACMNIGRGKIMVSQWFVMDSSTP